MTLVEKIRLELQEMRALFGAERMRDMEHSIIFSLKAKYGDIVTTERIQSIYDKIFRDEQSKESVNG